MVWVGPPFTVEGQVIKDCKGLTDGYNIYLENIG